MKELTLYGTPLERGILYVMETASALPVYAAAAFTVGLLGRDAVLIDGGNRADPYSLVSISKQHGLDHRLVLQHTHVSRAFTAYQFESIVNGLERFLRLTDAGFVGLLLPGRIFFDGQMDPSESRFMLGRCIRSVQSLARRREIFALAVDMPLPPALSRAARLHFSRNREQTELEWWSGEVAAHV